MRTKTLLIAVAALATGVFASKADNVYSANVVGYVNVNVKSGYNLIENPLNADGTNSAGSVIPFTEGGNFDGSSVLIWNGSGYTYYAYDSGYGGWIDASYNPVSAPVLPPGKGFFFNNLGTNSTISFAGQVVPAVGQTNTMALPPLYSLVGSVLPAGGALTNATLNFPIIDGGFSILKWDTASQKYVYYSYDTGYNPTSGWIDSSFNPTTEPTLNVGEALFYNNLGATVNWTQVLPAN